MNPLDLLSTARFLLTSSKGKPTQVSLRRAVSSTYYALFHCLACECANLLIGGAGSDRSKPAWRQVYRSLDHRFAKDQCIHQQQVLRKFPKDIEDFANEFAKMQVKRHDADYDPFATFTKSGVLADIQTAERTVRSFKVTKAKDRRAFCAFVLLKARKS